MFSIIGTDPIMKYRMLVITALLLVPLAMLNTADEPKQTSNETAPGA